MFVMLWGRGVVWWQVGFEEEMRRAKMLLSDQTDKSRTSRCVFNTINQLEK